MDKEIDKPAILTNIEDAGHINYFYNYPDGKKSLEIDFFREIDNDTPPIIERLINDDNVVLTTEERNKIIKYIASQISRVPFKKKGLNELNDNLLNDLNINITNDVTTDYLNSIITNTERHSTFLESKKLIIHKISNQNNFIIGDNPVITINTDTKYNIIFDSIPVAEYELYMMPISPRHIIIFFNPEAQIHIDKYIKEANQLQIERADRRVYANQKTILESEFKEYYKHIYDMLMTVNPTSLKKENIKRGNFIKIFPRAQIRFDHKFKEKLIADKIIKN